MVSLILVIVACGLDFCWACSVVGCLIKVCYDGDSVAVLAAWLSGLV